MRRGTHFAVIRGIIGVGKEEWSGVVSDQTLAHLATTGAPVGSATYYVPARDQAAAQAIVSSEMCPSQESIHGPPGWLPDFGDVVVYTDGACKTLGEGKLQKVKPPSPVECDKRGIQSRVEHRRQPQNPARAPAPRRTPSPGAPDSSRVVVDAAGWGIWFGEQCPLNASGPLEGPVQTSNRAELRALIAAIETVNSEISNARRVIVRSDCSLVVGARRDVVEALHVKAVPDRDLKLRLGAALRQLDERKVVLSLEWVKGHGISYGNHCADWLANEGSYDKAAQINPRAKFSRAPFRQFVAKPYIDYSAPRPSRHQPLRKVHSGGVSKPVHVKKKRRMASGWQGAGNFRDSHGWRDGRRAPDRHARAPSRGPRYYTDRDAAPQQEMHGLVPMVAGVARNGGQHANGTRSTPYANDTHRRHAPRHQASWAVDRNPATNWTEGAQQSSDAPGWSGAPQFAAFGAPLPHPPTMLPATMLQPIDEVIDLVSEGEEEAQPAAGTNSSDKVVEVIALD